MRALVDAGPLVALIDRRQALHAACVGALSLFTTPLVTTWPCFTEAMYFLQQSLGWPGQRELWVYLEKGAVTIHESGEAEQQRMRALMEQYQDTPMDLADASLVTLAEAHGISRIFTIDSDFHVYRINGKDAFDVFP